MISAPYAVTAAAGLPETELPESLLSTLPESVAPAPWNTKCQVVTWHHPADAAAIETFPAAIRPNAVALVAWALVRYAETPVGPYSEIAATVLPDGDGYGHIPFIVVDSLPSIVGGRVNWMLPKALARFAWSDADLAVNIAAEAPVQPEWQISVRWTPEDTAMPATLPSHVRQVGTDGTVGHVDSELVGSLAAAAIEVDGQASGPLGVLLRPGRYDGAMLRDCEFNVGPLVTA
jgi:Acetoacetate decarboxylase (ADC)